MAYLNVTEVESAIQALSATYPGQCQLITLPNITHEGRTSHAIRIGNGVLDNRPALLYIGSQHAREWGSCEICINVATDLLEAYTTGTGVGYGGKSFTAAQVQSLVNNFQMFIFPCVNPDGRHFSQTSDSMWRRNRNPVAPVDINRNYDFLWDYRTAFSPSSGVRVSDNPNDPGQTYHGAFPNSEPETRNVIYLLDTYPQIRWMIDIHSYSQLIYHNWGDDENQTSNSSMNFRNPLFNGTRGVNLDTAYKEYIPAGDLVAASCLVNQMQSALQAVRGVTYTTGQSFSLYPTSGTATDYPYSRHFVDPTKTKTLGFLIEWGMVFQPPWAEMENIILDVSSALVAFAIAAPCQCSVIEANLSTPALVFNDVPVGEQTARAIVFSVLTCRAATFQIVAGPSITTGVGTFGVLLGSTVTLPSLGTTQTREARLWLSFTGTNAGDFATGSVTVRLMETGQEWIISISANSIARPRVAVMLALDQSGSMGFPAGTTGATRLEVLKDAASTFMDIIHPNNGVGLIRFDNDAYAVNDATYPGLAMSRIGTGGLFDPNRTAAINAVTAHRTNTSGSTSVGDGLQMARNVLNAVPVADYEQKAIIVFTDGQENAPLSIADVAGSIDSRTFAIGLGNESQVDTAKLRSLTNSTGGYLLLSGILSNSIDDRFKLSKYFLQILAGVLNNNIILDPNGYIAPKTTVRIPFLINEADIDSTVVLMTDVPIVDMTIETPNGDIINAANAAGLGVAYTVGKTTKNYLLILPAAFATGNHAGTWSAILTVNEGDLKKYLSGLTESKAHSSVLSKHGARYSVVVNTFSNLKMEAKIHQNSYAPGATMILRTLLTEYGLPVEDRANVTAEIVRPDTTRFTLPLTEVEAGVFENSFVASMTGIYNCRFVVKGATLRGIAFTREQTLTGAILNPDSGDNGGLQPSGTNGDLLASLMKMCCKNRTRLLILIAILVFIMLILMLVRR